MRKKIDMKIIQKLSTTEDMFMFRWCFIECVRSKSIPDKSNRCAETPYLRTELKNFAVGAQKGRFCARKGRGVEGSRGPGFAALRAPRPSVSGSKAIRDEPGRLFLRFCAQGLMKASFQRPCAQNAKTLHLRAASELLCIARRGRDSNPRNLSVQQFSRLP